MVRTKSTRPIITNLTDYPKKDKSSITIVKSEHPLWEYEFYDFRGVFVGYVGPTKENPLYKSNT